MAKQGDQMIYKPSYMLGSAGWAILWTLLDIIMATMHNITPYLGRSQHPLTIPESAFEELGISSPNNEVDITHFHCCPNYLFTLTCPSRDELLNTLQIFQQGLCACIMWLASRVNYSVGKGFQARINWGTFVGMSWDEFLFHVSPAMVLAEAHCQGLTAKEITMHYYTNNEYALTCYIPYSPVGYPDLAAYIHFPYDSRYSQTSFFQDLPCLIMNYTENTTSTPGTSSMAMCTSNSDFKMKDLAIKDIMEQMGNLSLEG
ncbi:uncharacterized protein EV420DRAFT_1645028 [Desarmillaria tabescens]|uniref:Uncharacterized protein n=1 Tax=Armillaria tabescens TaxID=1929756 RepID=A0AA39K8H3_ARMTA|nr:uncharacterized protein EV420DRAFT_1645028 [Desarmillaria tabescens]KAK0454168.1 hypothetical protein EV420DRAFT_1645028 [Desarmillaria tabescens]